MAEINAIRLVTPSMNRRLAIGPRFPGIELGTFLNEAAQLESGQEAWMTFEFDPPVSGRVTIVARPGGYGAIYGDNTVSTVEKMPDPVAINPPIYTVVWEAMCVGQSPQPMQRTLAWQTSGPRQRLLLFMTKDGRLSLAADNLNPAPDTKYLL